MFFSLVERQLSPFCYRQKLNKLGDPELNEREGSVMVTVRKRYMGGLYLHPIYDTSALVQFTL